MEYYEHIVKNRNSCRGFEDREVEESKLLALTAYYEDEESRLVDGIATELKFFVGNVWEELKKSVGYNGFCIKAPAYLAIYSEVADHYLENAGYIGQGLTLKMTELGLSACWQTINDTAAAKAALGYETDKEVVCIVAFGYRSPDNDEKKAPKKSVDDLTDGYKYGKDFDIDFFYGDIEYGLRAMAHAQSFFNRQPYKVIVDDDQISLVGLPDEMTGEADRRLNYGIAMFNFYAVMSSVRASAPKWSFEPSDRDLGLPGDVTYVAKCRI
jgi:nitroreductase